MEMEENKYVLRAGSERRNQITDLNIISNVNLF